MQASSDAMVARRVFNLEDAAAELRDHDQMLSTCMFRRGSWLDVPNNVRLRCLCNPDPIEMTFRGYVRHPTSRWKHDERVRLIVSLYGSRAAVYAAGGQCVTK